MNNKIIGKDLRKKELLKKYLFSWIFYMKDVKMKKA
jgi:hypothetical protein